MALGTAFPAAGVPRRLLLAGAVAAMLPDADVVGFEFGIQYGDLLGHRGFTHSLLFAAVLGIAGAILSPRHRALGWLYLFLATASHGLLDALTDGGLGVAFFAPFDLTRYFFPVTPIAVSPIGIDAFFSTRGFSVLANELLWIWLPSALFVAVCLATRRI